MTKISYHASHEQFNPRKLLELVQLAESNGFEGVLSSDHFSPWNDQQGESAFAWSWLGAAMQATNLSFGVVNAPGQRYHPAIIAQAGATLANMFPERFWMALGSGQALNEHITGTYWPDKTQRNERLKECADIIRRLWNGETVTHKGLVTVEEAKLYTLPENTPLIVGAALTEETAGWLGSWADALITISHPIEKLKKIIKAFKKGGGEGKPLILKYELSYHSDEEKALQGAYDEWKTNIFDSNMLAELRSAKEFQAAGQYVDKQAMYEHVKISADIDKHIQYLQEYMELDFDEIILHNVNINQEELITEFGSKVLPKIQQFVTH